ncbi:MAG: hypothetical protein JWR85_4213 [Marmoricola sp.]|nr:hypothetical protein [Marmoricola sp.]
MRISLEKDDPGYVDVGAVCGAMVYLAGSARKNVITADEEKRYAKLHKLDTNGNPVIDYAKGEIVTEEFYGDVRIEFPNDDVRKIVTERMNDAKRKD